MKKLYRSEHNKKVAGVAGGLGEYTGIDPTVLRIIFVIAIILTGLFPGLLVYLILAVVMPKEGEAKRRDKENKE